MNLFSRKLKTKNLKTNNLKTNNFKKDYHRDERREGGNYDPKTWGGGGAGALAAISPAFARCKRTESLWKK